MVTWTVTGLPLTAYGLQGSDTVRVERVTDRQRTSGSRFNVQGSRVEVKTEVVHDMVYIERRDSVLVQSSRFKVQGGSLNPQPSSLILTLKWVFFIIIGLIALIITVKVCSLRR